MTQMIAPRTMTMDRIDRKSFRADLYAGIDRQANVVGKDAVKRRALLKTWKAWAFLLTRREKAWATVELMAERSDDLEAKE